MGHAPALLQAHPSTWAADGPGRGEKQLREGWDKSAAFMNQYIQQRQG